MHEVHPARLTIPFERGLHDLGEGIFAFLQPDGGWGWSNAGLILGDGASLVVDTLFDLHLTREMLDAMQPWTAANPIRAAVNTHGDPDHCFGNELLPADAEIWATTTAREAMLRATPEEVQGMFASRELGQDFVRFSRSRFGVFELEGIRPRPATRTFDGHAEVRVGGRAVELHELGPGHTASDTIVHVPDTAVVFAGDLVFACDTPLVWAGPISSWLNALDRILAMRPRLIVPGHGPVTDEEGVRDLAHYLQYVSDEATARFETGMGPEEAAEDIDLSPFADWAEQERIAVNVYTAYRELDPSLPELSVPEQFKRMAEWAVRHGRA
jgi:glyoxylase-like metal-dependent hydrolase (beta-lactamase superfamily II)